MSSSACIPLLELVALLAPTLGQEKAHDVVEEAVHALGVTTDPIEPAVAAQVLEALGSEPGMVGVAARFARQRLETRPTPSSAPEDHEEAPVSSGPKRGGAARHPSSPKRTVERYRVALLLAPSLGQEKSDEVVLASIRLLGLPEDRLDQRQALAVLEHLATLPGVVGLTARFAKARLLLLFSPPAPST